MPANATTAEIKKACHALFRKYHPDKNAQADPEKFDLIKEIYDILTNPEKRKEYDEHLAANRTTNQSPKHDNELSYYKSIDDSAYPAIENKKMSFLSKHLKSFLNDDKETSASDFSKFFDGSSKSIDNFSKPSTDTLKSTIDALVNSAIRKKTEEKLKEAEKKYNEDTIPDRDPEQCLLWKASKDGCAPIYVFSTMHVNSVDNIEDIFGDVLHKIIDEVDVVFTEVRNAPKPSFCEKLFSFDQQQISSWIEESCNDQIDKLVEQIALKLGKESLELDSDQIRYVVYLTFTQPEKFSKQVSKSYKNIKSLKPEQKKEYFRSSTERYLSGNVSFVQHPLVTKRNILWMPEFLAKSAQGKSSLVASGALHNHGKFGIPNLLEYEGYTLEPMMKSAPKRRTQIIRDLVYNRFDLFGFSFGRSKPAIPNKIQINVPLDNTSEEQNVSPKAIEYKPF